MKLSIIVPVYGVEKYIVQCISSLLIPDYHDYEIIVVNDGTKDKSIEILEQSIIDDRVRIIHKENGGLSSARNYGIKEARGEYIWVFDSDDWAETKLLPNLISMLNGADCIYFKSYFVDFEDTGEVSTQTLETETTSSKELYCSNNYFQPAPFYIYKKEILVNNNHYFKEGILHEDSLFTPIAITLCNNIVCFNEPIYHYRQRSGSITKTVSPKRLHDIMYVITELHKFGINRFQERERFQWGSTIATITNSLLFLAQKCNDAKTIKEVKTFVNSNSYLLDYLRNSTKNNKIMAILSQLTCGNLWIVYRFLYKVRYRS